MSINDVNRLSIRDLENLEKKSEVDLEMSREEVEQKKIENEKRRETWESCCLRVNKSMFQYITQMGLLSAVIAFCCFMLGTDSQPKELWVSILSTCIGLAIPTGMVQKEDKH